MKIRFLAAFATMLMASVPAYAMDCCKDGKCACCDKKDETPKDGEHKDHQH